MSGLKAQVVQVNDLHAEEKESRFCLNWDTVNFEFIRTGYFQILIQKWAIECWFIFLLSSKIFLVGTLRIPTEACMSFSLP